MERNKFGGNCYLEDINSIMSNNARRAKLNYSHKQENRWNMWTDNGGMTLSFVLNRGLFIPSISFESARTVILPITTTKKRSIIIKKSCYSTLSMDIHLPMVPYPIVGSQHA